MLSDFLLDPLRGRTRLWRVFWLYGLVVNCCFYAICAVILPGSKFTNRLICLGALLLTLYQLVALWRCAYNGPSGFVARYVRLLVVMALIFMPWVYYSLFENGISS